MGLSFSIRIRHPLHALQVASATHAKRSHFRGNSSNTMTAKKGRQLDQQIHLWLSPSQAQSCVSFSRAIKILRADCYSNPDRPIPMSWPSRELPEWVALHLHENSDEGAEFLTNLHECLRRDMVMLKREIPTLFTTLDLPHPPKGTFNPEATRSIIYTSVDIRHSTSDLQNGCDAVTRILDCAAFDRRELPVGWDISHGWPEHPIGIASHLSGKSSELAMHLTRTQAELRDAFPEPKFCLDTTDAERFRRQLVNASKALAAWEVADAPLPPDHEITIAEADLRLSELIMLLRTSEAVSPKTLSVPQPVEQETESITFLKLEAEILDVLDGVGLGVVALATRLDVNSSVLYKRHRPESPLHLLDYMKSQGWIANNGKFGFFRPDRPPESPQPKNPPKKKKIGR